MTVEFVGSHWEYGCHNLDCPGRFGRISACSEEELKKKIKKLKKKS